MLRLSSSPSCSCSSSVPSSRPQLHRPSSLRQARRAQRQLLPQLIRRVHGVHAHAIPNSSGMDQLGVRILPRERQLFETLLVLRRGRCRSPRQGCTRIGHGGLGAGYRSSVVVGGAASAGGAAAAVAAGARRRCRGGTLLLFVLLVRDRGGTAHAGIGRDVRGLGRVVVYFEYFEEGEILVDCCCCGVRFLCGDMLLLLLLLLLGESGGCWHWA